MEEAMSPVAGQGFAARTLPLPLYVRAHAEALVPADRAREELVPAGADVPLLDIAVAVDRPSALRQLAERAAALRLRRGSRHRAALCVGAGDSREEAFTRAVYAGLARRRAAAGIGEGVLIRGRDTAAAPGLRGVRGRLDCYLLGEEAGVPTIGAVLRLDRMPRPFHAVVCDLWERRGVERAVEAVLRQFVVASLPVPAREGVGRAGRDRPAAGRERPVPPDPAVTGEIPYEGLSAGPPADEPGELRAGLRRHGLRASVRPLGPEGGEALVACRLKPSPGPVPGGSSGGAWGELDVTALGLRAPRQMSLAYERDETRISRIRHETSRMSLGLGTLPFVDVAAMSPSARRLLGHAYRDFRHSRRAYPLLPGPADPAADAAPELPPLDRRVRHRRSRAPMGGGELGLAELSRLLTLSCGTAGSAAAGEDVRLPPRAAPSAGGLCSSDLFLLVNRVAGVERGLYYFHPGRRVLHLVDDTPDFAEAAARTGSERRVSRAAVMVVHVGAFCRGQGKYGERGYHTVLLDPGRLTRSVVTAATALGLVAHPVPAFVDDYFNALVGVDGTDDAVLYLTVLGPREEGDPV